MGQISNSAIIVLCIVAAGVVVLVGWAITHRMRGGEDEDERAFYTAESGTGGGNGGASQFTYMREARERYKEDIMSRFGPHRHHQRPRQQSMPMSRAPTSGLGASDYSY